VKKIRCKLSSPFSFAIYNNLFVAQSNVKPEFPELDTYEHFKGDRRRSTLR